MVSKVILGENDLYSWCLNNQRTDLIDEWINEKNPEPMSAYTKGSMKKVWWHCSNGHEWEAMISNRVKGRKCPFCSNKRVLIGYNDLETWCKQNNMQNLIKEWDYEQNGLTPKDYVYGSQVKVNWICANGHTYKMSIYHRSVKKGNCPYCSSQLLLKGYNDLATKNPVLADEWNYEKNGDLTPADVMVKSNIKVWWTCKSRHNWLTSIADRSEGNGCPYCSGRKALPGYNDLLTLNPELAAEWHPIKNDNLTPTDVRPHSAKKVWWRCIRGHEWKATIDSRSSGRGCPFCNQQTSFAEQALLYYIKQFFLDTMSRDSHLGIELDIYIPSLSVAVEYDGRFWHQDTEKAKIDIQKNKTCQENGIKLIRVREPGLTNLIGSINIFRADDRTDNSLDQAISEVLFELGISDITVDVEKDKSSILSCYSSELKNNSLESRFPKIAKEWHPTLNGKLLPNEIPPGSSYRAWWKCSEGHEWQVSVNTRTNGQTTCPICDNIRRKNPIVPYDRSLKKWCIENNRMALLDEYSKTNKWSADEIAPYSNYKVSWVCIKGHKWEATVGSRVSGNNCPYCSGHLVIPGENDLQTLRPDLAAEWNYERNGNITPSNVTAQSNKKAWWKCSKGHEWKAIIGNRAKGRGCPYCSNKTVLKGFNDLQTLKPELAKEWHPVLNNSLLPTQVTISSGKKVWWICSQGHEWEAPISNRSKGIGCPYCSGRIPIAGVNDLATKMPDLSAEWHPTKNGNLTPMDVSPGSERKVWWRCSEGHEWQAYVHNRTRGNGCPICYKNKRIVINITTGEIYSNAVEAGNAYNVTSASIVFACKHHRKCKGCYWKHKEK